MIPGPCSSGSMITAAPTLCSVMKFAASRSVRSGVIVRTSSVIASQTLTGRIYTDRLGGSGHRAGGPLGEALRADAQRPVEARAVVLQRDDRGELDQLAGIEMLAQRRDEIV